VPLPNAHLIEISENGQWLFWAAPTGPLYKIRTDYLDDPAMTDDELEKHVEGFRHRVLQWLRDGHA
jgi:hypothetical protein